MKQQALLSADGAAAQPGHGVCERTRIGLLPVCYQFATSRRRVTVSLDPLWLASKPKLVPRGVAALHLAGPSAKAIDRLPGGRRANLSSGDKEQNALANKQMIRRTMSLAPEHYWTPQVNQLVPAYVLEYARNSLQQLLFIHAN